MVPGRYSITPSHIDAPNIAAWQRISRIQAGCNARSPTGRCTHGACGHKLSCRDVRADATWSARAAGVLLEPSSSALLRIALPPY
jgi:hypothetical protein